MSNEQDSICALNDSARHRKYILPIDLLRDSALIAWFGPSPSHVMGSRLQLHSCLMIVSLLFRFHESPTDGLTALTKIFVSPNGLQSYNDAGKLPTSGCAMYVLHVRSVSSPTLEC